MLEYLARTLEVPTWLVTVYGFGFIMFGLMASRRIREFDRMKQAVYGGARGGGKTLALKRQLEGALAEGKTVAEMRADGSAVIHKPIRLTKETPVTDAECVGGPWDGERYDVPDERLKDPAVIRAPAFVNGFYLLGYWGCSVTVVWLWTPLEDRDEPAVGLG